MIRVVLVDDHVLLRDGTAVLLSANSSIEIIAQTGLGYDVLNLAAELAPDVIILDIRLPDINGVDVARILRQEFPAIKILMLSAYQHEQYVRALFAIGVHGYLLKTASGPELIAAVQAIYHGETVLSTAVTDQIISNNYRAGIGATEALSDRERNVLTLIGKGASNKEIASKLSLGVRTVETHVSNAMAKLGARSRTEAVNLAVQRGFVVLDLLNEP